MPKIVDKKIKKKDILKVAIKTFAQRGYANTKMADIAVAANIGKGTIYEYFKNKNEIFEQAFHYFMEIMETAHAREIFKLTDPVEKLRALFIAWANSFYDHIEFMEIMLDFWADAVRNKDNKKIKVIDLDKIYKDYRKLIMAILEEGIRLGKFKPINTFLLASLMVGTIDGIMLQWILDKNVFNVKEAVECFLDEVLHGIYKV